MKFEYIAAGVLALLYVRGAKAKKSDTQLQDTMSSQKGSDWIGTAWDRLSGRDLIAPGYSNIATGPVADPGKVGQANAGIVGGWNGTLGA